MVLRGYFDEGGTHKGSPVTCVAGYLFFPEKGLAFPDKWATALVEAHLSPDTIFRAADWWVRRPGSPYENWTREECESLNVSLVKVICETASLGAMSAVSSAAVEQFMAASPGIFESEVGSRYALCLMGVLTVLGSRLDAQNKQDAVHYIFESGDENQLAANQVLDEVALNSTLCQRFHYGGHSFLPKTAFPHFQAADLLAWEWQQLFKSPDGELVRPSLRTLLACVPHMHQPFVGPKNITAQAIINAFYGLGGSR